MKNNLSKTRDRNGHNPNENEFSNNESFTNDSDITTGHSEVVRLAIHDRYSTFLSQ